MSLTLSLIICATIAGLTSGSCVLSEDNVATAVGANFEITTSLPSTQKLYLISWNFGPTNIVTSVNGRVEIAREYRGRVNLHPRTGSLILRKMALSDSGEYSVNISLARGYPQIPGLTTLNVLEPVSNVTVTVSGTDLMESNSSVSLSCSASGSSLSFLWFNGSAEVKTSDRVQLTDGGATLDIDPVLRYDSRRPFKCRVSDSVSSRTSAPVQLSINYGPDNIMLKTSPLGEHHEEGSNVSLSCSVDSMPDAHYEWFLNGEILPSTGAVLNMEKIQMKQSGNYSCSAFNSQTLRNATSQPVPITVWEKITNAILHPSPVHPVEGLSFNLTCDASGPVLIREWFINGLNAKPSDNIVFYDQKRVLSFKVLSRFDHGEVNCTLGNPAKSFEMKYHMNVNYGPDKVQITGPGKLHEGNTLKLICSAESVPTANYSWTKDGDAVGKSREYTKDNIRSSDGGVYACRATNDIAMKTSEASLSVIVTEGLYAGAIAGITLACIAAVSATAAGFYIYIHKGNK